MYTIIKANRICFQLIYDMLHYWNKNIGISKQFGKQQTIQNPLTTVIFWHRFIEVTIFSYPRGGHVVWPSCKYTICPVRSNLGGFYRIFHFRPPKADLQYPKVGALPQKDRQINPQNSHSIRICKISRFKICLIHISLGYINTPHWTWKK